MKRLIFILIMTFVALISLSSQSLATSQAVSLKGYVWITVTGQYTFIDLQTLRSFPVKAANKNVKDALLKLTDFDTITGIGSLNEKDEALTIEAIDFVSLRRLLGQWKGDKATVHFQTSSKVVFKSDNQETLYHYAIAPSVDESWRLLLTDDSSVVLGRVTLRYQAAELELYNPQTGEIDKRLYLQKVP